MWVILQIVLCFNQRRTFTCMRIYDWNTSHGKNMKLSGVYYAAAQQMWLCQPTSEGGLAPFIPYNTSKMAPGLIYTRFIIMHFCSQLTLRIEKIAINCCRFSATANSITFYQIVNVNLLSTEKDYKINTKKHPSMELCYQLLI